MSVQGTHAAAVVDDEVDAVAAARCIGGVGLDDGAAVGRHDGRTVDPAAGDVDAGVEVGAVKAPAVTGGDGAVVRERPAHLAADILAVFRGGEVLDRRIDRRDLLLHFRRLLLAGGNVALILRFQCADVLDLGVCRIDLLAQRVLGIFQLAVGLLQLLLLCLELGFLLFQILLLRSQVSDDFLIALRNFGDDAGAHQAVIVAVRAQHNRERVAVSSLIGGLDALAQQVDLFIYILLGFGNFLLGDFDRLVHRVDLQVQGADLV